jgi:hypothetical protein
MFASLEQQGTIERDGRPLTLWRLWRGGREVSRQFSVSFPLLAQPSPILC